MVARWIRHLLPLTAAQSLLLWTYWGHRQDVALPRKVFLVFVRSIPCIRLIRVQNAMKLFINILAPCFKRFSVGFWTLLCRFCARFWTPRCRVMRITLCRVLCKVRVGSSTQTLHSTISLYSDIWKAECRACVGFERFFIYLWYTYYRRCASAKKQHPTTHWRRPWFRKSKRQKNKHTNIKKISRRRQTLADRCHLLPISDVIHEQRVL